MDAHEDLLPEDDLDSLILQMMEFEYNFPQSESSAQPQDSACLTMEDRKQLGDFQTLLKTGNEKDILAEVSKEQYQDKLDIDIIVESTRMCACWRLLEEVQPSVDTEVLSGLVVSGKCSHVTSDEAVKRLISKRMLHMAVAANMADLTKYLLEKGCDVNCVTMMSRSTPIYLAILHSHQDMVKLLLDWGANLNMLSCQHTPLMEAVEIGDGTLIKMLLENPKCEVNTCNDRGETALKLAASVNEVATVSQLLSADADPNKKDVHGRTPIFDALTNGQTHMVEELIKAGADVNVKDRNNQFPLLFSVHQNDLVSTRLLLEGGANPNFESQDGFSLLQIAIYTDYKEIVEMLFEYNVDTNATNSSKYSALHIAAWDGYMQSVRLLLKGGAEHDNRTQDGNTPLSLAAHGNHFDVVEMLLPLGCAVNNMDKDSDTPLHYASYNGCLRSVEALIKEGASPNVRNALNTTPLWNAVYKNHVSVVSYLVSLNVDLEVKSCGIDQHSNQHDVVHVYNEPRSPLWVAVSNNYADITYILLEAGYNLWQEDWLSGGLYHSESKRTLEEMVRAKFSTPPALQHSCKMFFRNSYKTRLVNVLKDLEIPNSLKDNLLLKDLNKLLTSFSEN